VKEEGVSESGPVAPSQSESHLEAGVDAETQRREGAKGEGDLVEGEKAEEADCTGGTLPQTTGTVAIPGTETGAGESGSVAVGQSESKQEAGVNAETSARSVEAREDAKGEKDLAEGVVKEEVAGESGLVTVGQSDSHREAGVNAEAQRREDAKDEKESAEGVDCSNGTLSQATGAGESELVTPSQSESRFEVGEGGNAKVRTRRREDAMARERHEDAKNAGDFGQEGGETR